MNKNLALPRSPGHFLTGNLPELRRDPLQFYTEMRDQHGDFVAYRLGFYRCFFVSRPQAIKHVLKDNHQNYRKTVFYAKMRPLLGMGLLTSDGEFWRRQRRLAQPAFHRDQLEKYSAVMIEACESMLARWLMHHQVGERIELTAEMMRLTLEIGAQSFFGLEVKQDSEVIKAAITTSLSHMMDKFESLLDIPEAIPTARNRRFNRAKRDLDRIVMRIIGGQRGQAGTSKDLLNSLMRATDDASGQGMNEKQLRDEVITMLIASQETTAMALGWTLYLISKHPAVEKSILQELTEKLGAQDPTATTAGQLTYLGWVIQESMRLYPPAWWYGRTPIKDDEICGYKIPAGSVLTMVPYATHRDPNLWPEPEKFIPERFSPEASAGRSDYAYIPFAAGPRNCIGKDFALLELRLVLSRILRRYHLVNQVPEPVGSIPGVTLRPQSHLWMALDARQ